MKGITVIAALAISGTLACSKAEQSEFSRAKVELAKVRIQQLVHEAYPQWVMDRPGQACPAALSELLEYVAAKDLKDPWGHDLVMLCGDAAPAKARFAVASAGADGTIGTHDDVNSWE